MQVGKGIIRKAGKKAVKGRAREDAYIFAVKVRARDATILPDHQSWSAWIPKLGPVNEVVVSLSSLRLYHVSK